MGFLTEWPPSVEQYYLPIDPQRPFFQGDVFEDVPFVKAKAGSTPDSKPNIVIERRCVCALLFPCDMYSPEGRLAKVQAVALVREQSKGDHLPPDWDGCYNLFPYPELNGSEPMWFADFRTTANIDRTFLRADKRIASLSLLGWSYFRQRIALNYTRSKISLNLLIENGKEPWAEQNLWKEWCGVKSSSDGFHEWYNSPLEDLAGSTPRAAATRQGRFLDVQRLIRSELAD